MPRPICFLDSFTSEVIHPGILQRVLPTLRRDSGGVLVSLDPADSHRAGPLILGQAEGFP